MRYTKLTGHLRCPHALTRNLSSYCAFGLYSLRFHSKTLVARFISRPNRFIAQVELEGKIGTIHVKNTGRCKELLLPDSRVILSEADNPARKTRYDLIAVEKAGLGLVNIDSQDPNKVMAEWLAGHYQNSVFDTIALLGAVPESPCYKGLRGFCFLGA